jgi:DNA-binding CsgD family transcriptional regulator
MRIALQAYGVPVFRAYLLMSSVEMALGYQRVLTPREREVALLVARGLSNKLVARELGLSTGTVKQHLHRIFQKLGVRSRSALRPHSRFLPAAE